MALFSSDLEAFIFLIIIGGIIYLTIKFISSEIVRGMTNAKLNEEQQKMLLYVSNCVLCNHLIYKNENKRRNLIFNKSNIGVKEISRESIKKNLSNLLYLAKQAVKNKGKND